MSGVLVPAKSCHSFCTCCHHSHILGRAVGCIGELSVVLTIGDNIGHCFQGPVCTSKHRNGQFSGERGWCSLLVTRVQRAFPNLESVAMLNEKKQKRNRQKSQKEREMVLTVGDDVWGVVFRIQCAFQNMKDVAMLNK